MSILKREGFQGALVGLILIFPIVALCTLFYRFPIPFSEYMSGSHAILPSLVAVIFYGLVGGFLVIALLGYLGGVLAFHLGQPDRKKIRIFGLLIISIFDTGAAMILAVLDKMIGPW